MKLTTLALACLCPSMLWAEPESTGVSLSSEAEAPTAATPSPEAEAEPVTDLLNLSLRARVDWQNAWQQGHTDHGNSGFEGKYLILRADGRIIPSVTYSWRQRFNKHIFDSSFWDATDWIYVQWSSPIGIDLRAGKDEALIGGYEYDRNPADVYSASLFWMNCSPFQMGVSAGYHFGANDKLTFQVSQSMFHYEGHRDMYDFNLFWNSKHGPWQALWSVNMMEYASSHFISYIALGNHIEAGPCTLELDFMNRAAAHQTFLFKDCSVIADLAYQPSPAWKIHGKFTYDVNRSGTDADLCVLNGTELKMAGGGVEFYPLRKERTSLRLHANCYYSWGTNTNTADLMQHRTTLLDFGITWDMHLLHLK